MGRELIRLTVPPDVSAVLQHMDRSRFWWLKKPLKPSLSLSCSSHNDLSTEFTRVTFTATVDGQQLQLVSMFDDLARPRETYGQLADCLDRLDAIVRAAADQQLSDAVDAVFHD